MFPEALYLCFILYMVASLLASISTGIIPPMIVAAIQEVVLYAQQTR